MSILGGKIKDFTDPKNPLWLEIVRYVDIIVNFLLFIFSTIALINGIISAEYYLVALVVIVVIHIIEMLSLNMVFNIQQIRDNTARQISIQSEILDLLKTNYSKNSNMDGFINHDTQEEDVDITNNENVENFEEGRPQDVDFVYLGSSNQIEEEKGLENESELKENNVSKNDLEPEDEIKETNEEEIIHEEKENKIFVSPIHGKVFMPEENQKSSVTIPSGFDSIGEYAFKNNVILEEIYTFKCKKSINASIC